MQIIPVILKGKTMPIITLPDGKQLKFEQAVSVLDVATSISPNLAKATLAAKVNDKLVDVTFMIKDDATIRLLTERDPEGLDVIRHSTAHLLAHAVKELFPKAQVTIGPVIENGFYYDFAFERAFTEEDLASIEQKMQEIAGRAYPVKRQEISRTDAIKLFEEMGEKYKVQIIRDIPETDLLTFYQQGDFIDLCRGPHVPNTSFLKAFKLMKVAGAYWRGDSKNEMLQRIYGTAWKDKKDLNAYIEQLAEAEKRDHRKLAKQFDLFHLQEESPGMVFWHPKGWTIYQVLESYVRKMIKKQGYQEIKTPQIVDRSLWERSGHWAEFSEEMFTLKTDDREYAIKPMNCPCHIQVFNYGLRSYRELPLRLAEFGSCHRNEPSGALHGLMRVRWMVQDDGHIFCTEEQIQNESADFIDLLFQMYRDLGFNDVTIRLATRPDKRIGSDETWDKAEKALADALDSKGLNWELKPKEGAFYGPKIEFHLRDCIGRMWQCGTLQVDFFMPERLGASYIAEDSSRKTPVMLHRAALGSLERFLGILIEHHAGAFPAWFAPIQVVVMNITEKQSDYVQQIVQELENNDIRVISDLRNEKIGFKIREHTLQRIPYLLVAGDREVDSQTIAVRTRTGQDLGSIPLAQFIEHLRQDVAQLGRST